MDNMSTAMISLTLMLLCVFVNGIYISTTKPQNVDEQTMRNAVMEIINMSPESAVVIMQHKLNIITTFNPRFNVDGQLAVLNFNLLNPFVARIFVVFATDESNNHTTEIKAKMHLVDIQNKIQILSRINRLTIKDAIDISNARVPIGDIVVILNSDIVIQWVTSVNFDILYKPEFANIWLIISRRLTFVPFEYGYFEENNDLCHAYKGSADAFAFVTPIYYSNEAMLDIYLGTRSIESRLTFELNEMGYGQFNPCYFITLIHYHFEEAYKRIANTKFQIYKNNKTLRGRFAKPCRPSSPLLSSDNICHSVKEKSIKRKMR